ncbi:TPA: hypothetical protein UPS10_002868, partial [Listeria monocytogenes]|nr:hypothetical protein [Listeria monocytogenes]HEL7087564.1 hypothetical protein [Listeria monocytogenes]
MSKRTKIIILVIVLIITMLSILGGYFYMQHQEQEKKDLAFFNDQKEKITIYLKYNIPDFNTVTFTNEEFN